MPTSVQCSWMEFDLPDGALGVPNVCNPCQVASSQGLRLFDGQVQVATLGPNPTGFGFSWRHSLTNSNTMLFAGCSGPGNQGFGYGWTAADLPYLVSQGGSSNNHAVVYGAKAATWFEKSVGSYQPLIGQQSSLAFDAATNQFVLTDAAGNVIRFNALTDPSRPGGFVSFTSPGGMTLSVTATDGARILELQRCVTIDGVTVIESLLYEYTPNGSCPPLLFRVTLRRSGAWIPVQRITYGYYDNGAMFGNNGDLQTAFLENWDGAAWQGAGTSCYRYYGSGQAAGFKHGLQYIVKPATYAKLQADGYNPLTVSSDILADYADNYYEYDGAHRVVTHRLQGGSRTFTYAYTQSGFANDPNAWKFKTTETQPDGSTRIVFSNYAGFPMLDVLQNGSDQQCEFNKYSSDFKVLLHAHASAITGYDETKADLLNQVGENYRYLCDDAGLIETYTYHAPSGNVASESVQQGELGTPILIRLMEYTSCCSSASSLSSSFSSGRSSSTAAGGFSVWFQSKVTVYPSDTDPLTTEVTAYDYTFYLGTCAIQQRVTTFPFVSTDQNDMGVADTRRDYFDIYGNLTWRMDERGLLTRMTYDIVTGALSRRVDDADASSYADAPAGWTTPFGGSNLVTNYTFDTQGRITREVGPAHTLDTRWMVYL